MTLDFEANNVLLIYHKYLSRSYRHVANEPLVLLSLVKLISDTLNLLLAFHDYRQMGAI